MKAKPFILIIITLLLGFLLGILTSALLRHKRMRPVRVFSSERYLRGEIYKAIEPSDDQQKKLELIIDRFGKEGRVIRDDFRKEFDKHNDKLWTEIRSVLTPGQIELLEELNRKRTREMRHFRQDTTRKGRGDWDRNSSNKRRGSSGRRRADTVSYPSSQKAN